eukprot:TRINITY_DN3236_c0_g1_i8.p1 TRINITY_DN3236_c0_g1~~TRINITY_DN3236_c0_g1_i8.p1  ORF type:complete len:430 (+),score=32.65 TRINITY_DN3236_c0_g1_i8:89-1378(+)
MGNRSVSSNSKYTTIQLNCDFTTCVPKKEYKGTLEITVFTRCLVECVAIEICGAEWSKAKAWDDPSGRNNDEFFKQVIMLDLPNNKGVVKPGSYRLPFFFVLPNDARNSFHKKIKARKYGEVTGCIEYSCTANVYGPKRKLLLQDKKEFEVMTPMENVDNYVVSKFENVAGWFGASKGSCNISMKLNKTALYHKEPLLVTFTLDCTKCNLGINRLHCSLYEETTISREKKFFYNEPSVKTNLQVWKLQGVEAGRSIVYTQQFDIPESSKDLPYQTINTSYIQQNYVLQCKPSFNSLFGNKNMMIEAKFNISQWHADDFVNEVDIMNNERNYEEYKQMEEVEVRFVPDGMNQEIFTSMNNLHPDQRFSQHATPHQIPIRMSAHVAPSSLVSEVPYQPQPGAAQLYPQIEPFLPYQELPAELTDGYVPDAK